MGFEFPAFDLTLGEKHEILGEIKAILLQMSALIARAENLCSEDDYMAALSQIDHALILSSDRDACDPSLAPLATCHLYRGQILLRLGRRQEACESFNLAVSSETRALTDAPAVRDAAKRILEVEKRRDSESRSAHRPSIPPRTSSHKRGPGPVYPEPLRERNQRALRMADQIAKRDNNAHMGEHRRRTVVVEKEGELYMQLAKVLSEPMSSTASQQR
ncbi:hypothetical protein GGR50DRAFT_272405 [Xylaria sp. CBS 124048]|nr:hypothetical protein GGR50DRAFT_272405 [Xylaria sp. CBS 124048]